MVPDSTTVGSVGEEAMDGNKAESGGKNCPQLFGDREEKGAGSGCGILGFLPPNSDSDILTFNVMALGRSWGLDSS